MISEHIVKLLESNDWQCLSIEEVDRKESGRHRYVKMYPENDVCFSLVFVWHETATSVVLDMFDFEEGSPRVVCAFSHWTDSTLHQLITRLNPKAAAEWAKNQATQEYTISKTDLVPAEPGRGLITGSGMICVKNIEELKGCDPKQLQNIVTGDRELSLVFDNVARRLPIFVAKVLEVVAP